MLVPILLAIYEYNFLIIFLNIFEKGTTPLSKLMVG